MNRLGYVDLPPAQIYARELDEGRYHRSERTMYRILKTAGQDGERRRQAAHPPRTVPELVADGPSQVWSWDITRLAGPGFSTGLNALSRQAWLFPYMISPWCARQRPVSSGSWVKRPEYVAPRKDSGARACVPQPSALRTWPV
ncbi:hypothetical protein [Streptomyces cadmiisoli]|uniref:hypothetical protein n=1 Tax=Streptomyces cadmiisoli TaxID=2184053 RepID=UPI003D748152